MFPLSTPREAVLQDPTPAQRWLLVEFKHAHMHSKQRNGKYLITLMMDDIDPSEIDDANLKIHVETKTYLNCKDLVSNYFLCTCLLSQNFCALVIATFWKNYRILLIPVTVLAQNNLTPRIP